MKKNTSRMNKKVRKIEQILGINIISTSKQRLLARINENLSHNSHFYIVTPNPELILMAQKNNELKEALNSSEFAVPDGIGLSQAQKLLSFEAPKFQLFRILTVFFKGLSIGLATFTNNEWLTDGIKPIKGRELFVDLIKLADKNKWKVFLLGGKESEAVIAAVKLKTQYKNLKIESSPGPILNKKAKPVSDLNRKIEIDDIKKINKFIPDLLFVAMENPKQEIWVHAHIKDLRIGGAMCVGGTFRYVSGMSKLPPDFLAKIGLEWLWRLVTEPRRFGRIVNAVIIFPWKVFLYKLKQ